MAERDFNLELWKEALQKSMLPKKYLLDNILDQYLDFEKNKPKNFSCYFIAIPEGCKIVDMLPSKLAPLDRVCIVSHPETLNRILLKPVDFEISEVE